jgi:phosphoenolpyruvate-protein phosphotransferase (PTS system enzyme I)
LLTLLQSNFRFELGCRLDEIGGRSGIEKIKNIIADVKSELEAEGIPFNNNIQFGIMIETPATAILSDMLAWKIDFFSIAIDDLLQYTTATDKADAKIKDLFESENSAILRLIKIIRKNAQDQGIWVGICSESNENTTDSYI